MNLFHSTLVFVAFSGMITPAYGPTVQPGNPAGHSIPAPVPGYLENGIAWLANAQSGNGGWGAGSHNRQDIRDPRAVQVDPATTAISAMALVRSGSSLNGGPHSENVSRALKYVLLRIEESPEEGRNITTLTGTQPQTKLGQNIDVSLCAQFLTRILPDIRQDERLKKRVTAALDKCLRKIQRGQSRDGSFAGGTWAGVLQSAMANSALEMGQAAGREVDEDVLRKSKAYQEGNIDSKTGEVKTEDAAGVSLYSITGNQRATARDRRRADEIISGAKEQGILSAEEEPSVENLVKAGADRPEAEKLMRSFQLNEHGRRQLQDDRVLAGFGNNGGEEYLSYMLTSESMVIAGENHWASWNQKISGRLEKIQNPNGSWSGHHCITSPVFCTAAVVLAMTADRDADLLIAGNISTQGK